MNKHKSQSGFAHLMILTVILGLGLAGALGYTFYQSFANNKDANPVVSKNDANKDAANETKDTITYKTYTTDKYNVSFKYPNNWVLGGVTAPFEGDAYLNRSMDIKNSSGEVVATLIIGVNGIGGTCSDDNGNPHMTTFSVLDASPSSVSAKKPVSMSFVVSNSENSSKGYAASYGLTDTYVNKTDYQVCMFYNLFESNINAGTGYGYNISFGNGISTGNRYFASLDDAKQYIKGDEYQEIKKMILSLTY